MSANLFIATVLLIGASGLVAQGLLLRELLVSFYGNELTLGIGLANWVALEALGVYLIGRYMDVARDKLKPFILLQIAFSFFLPASIYLARSFHSLQGIPFGEGVGLPTVFAVSFLVLSLTGFCHGALFSACCKLHSLKSAEAAGSIGRVYALETFGTIAGGVAFTFIFIPYLGPFQAACLVSIFNLFLCFVILRRPLRTALNYFIIAGIVLCLWAIGNSGLLENASLKNRWGRLEILSSRNSAYGNIAVAKQREQFTFYYNGLPVVVTPNPNRQFVEEFGNIPLLFHPAPKKVLVIGAGAGGLLNEIEKHQVSGIDYAELDPMLIRMINDYPTSLTRAELSDKRLKVINTDGRLFLKETDERYDCILVGLSSPSDLASNRIFTQEFFALAGQRLRGGGIFSLWLPGSLTYLSDDLAGINASINAALCASFRYVRLVPGEYNIFLASDSDALTKVTAAGLSAEIEGRRIKTAALVPGYLEYRLNDVWQDWFTANETRVPKMVNQDMRPSAVYRMLVYSNNKFSSKVAQALRAFEKMRLAPLLAVLAALTFVTVVFARIRRPARAPTAICIFTTGFFSMLVNLILLFTYQTHFGSLYHKLAILITIFMAGIGAGGIWASGCLGKVKKPGFVFACLELGIAVFALFAAGVVFRVGQLGSFAETALFLSLFGCGLLTGFEFPFAAKLIEDKDKAGGVSGLLYAADLLGGWFAGIFGGVIMLPVLGVLNCCVLIAAFKLSSLTVFLVSGRKTGDEN